jgi:chromosome segregation ATPase
MPANGSSEAEPWHQKYEQMQAESAVRETQFQQRYVELQAEHTKAREQADALDSKVKELQGIVESLTREIHDREAAMQKYRRQLEQHPAQANLEHSGSYERELNAYRQELERDRQDLNEQIYQLQARQAEIEATAREAELQMSHERAILARERSELTRMREEIRISRERTVREGGVRERLAQLHLLKEKIAGLSPSAPGDALRTSAEIVTADHSDHSVPGAVGCTAEAVP